MPGDQDLHQSLSEMGNNVAHMPDESAYDDLIGKLILTTFQLPIHHG
jgi:hypothetical protein